MKIDITDEYAKSLKEAVVELFEAIPKSRRANYLGHLNELCLTLEGRMNGK